MELSVVIPAFNEQGVIKQTLDDIEAYLNLSDISYEIIVVDDGSTDATQEILKSISHISVIQHSKNMGKGAAVRTGVLQSTGDLILYMDADNSTKIDELPAFLLAIKKYDILLGSRAIENAIIVKSQHGIKVVLGKIGNAVIRSVLGLPIHDTQCGFKLFKRSAVSIFHKQTLDGWGFDFELLFIAHRLNFTFKELPVKWENNIDSKVRLRDYVKTLFEVMKIRFNAIKGIY